MTNEASTIASERRVLFVNQGKYLPQRTGLIHREMKFLVSISTSISAGATLRRPSSRIYLIDAGKLVFAQLTSHLPLSTFRCCLASI
jgi:hypothetical protein